MDPKVDVDNILYSLGRLGKYQKLQLVLLAFFTFENSFHLISIVYIGYRPPYRCADINITSYLHHHQHYLTNNSDIDIQYGKCDINILVNESTGVQKYKEKCINGYKFGIPADRSTVTDWDLVCSGAERSEFAQTLIMLGQAVGALIFAPLADKLGRKPCNVTARILYFLTALATVFTPNIDAFLIFRFLQGTFQGGSVMTNAILFVEIVPKELRHKIEAFITCAWTTGLVFVSLVGYLCRDLSWRYMQLILALITVHTLFDWLFLEESLRWLIANGKKERAEKLLKKACRMNHMHYQQVIDNVTPAIEMTIKVESNSVWTEKIESEEEDNFEQKHITDAHNKTLEQGGRIVDESEATDTDQVQVLAKPNKDKRLQVQETDKVEKYSILTMLKHRQILLSSAVLWLAWITITLTYYGLMLTASKLSGDRFLNNILSSLAEIPAMVFQVSLVNRIGRKWMLTTFHAIAGVSLVLATVSTTYKDEYSWLPILANIFSFVGRFAISGAFSTVFLYTPELYPTNMRNAGLGMASMISRIGSMMSPFAITLAEHVTWGPAAVFAVMNVIVTIVLLPLPETMGRELPTTLAELKAWHKNKNSA